MTIITGNEYMPPEGENDWHTGSETFSRKEVYNLLWTQRAMISNDMKRYYGNQLSKEMFELLDNPRIPEY